MIVRTNFQSRIVAPMVGISDLVNLSSQLHVGLLLGFRTHPVHGIHFLSERGFERVHHLLDALLALGRERTRDVGLPQRLSDVAVFRLNAAAPEWQNLFRAE